MLAESYSEARLDLSKLDRDIKAATKKIERVAKQLERKLRLSVEVDTTAAERKLRNFERTVERTRRRIQSRAIDVDLRVTVPTTAATAAGRSARDAAREGFGDGDLQVRLALDTRRFDGALRRATERLRRLTSRRYQVQVEVDYDEDAFARLQDAIVGANEARRLRVDVEFDVDLDAARAEVRRAREELRLLLAAQGDIGSTTVSTTVELDGVSEVLAGVAAIRAALAALPNDTNLGVDLSRNDGPGVAGAATPALINGFNELIEALDEVGTSLASILEGLDAAQGITGRLAPTTAREQFIEAARAANAIITTEARDTANKVAEQAKKSVESARSIRPEGASEAVADAERVAQSVGSIPDEFNRLDAQLAELSVRLQQLVVQAARFDIDVDGSAVVAEASAIRAEVEGLLSRAVDLSLRLDGDAELLARIATITAAIQRLDSTVARIGVDASGVERVTAELGSVEGLAEALDGYEVAVQIRTTGGPAAVAAAELAQEQIEAATDDVTVRVRTVFDRIDEGRIRRDAKLVARIQSIAAKEADAQIALDRASAEVGRVAAERAAQRDRLDALEKDYATAAEASAKSRFDFELREARKVARALLDEQRLALATSNREFVRARREQARAQSEANRRERQSRSLGRQLDFQAPFDGVATILSDLSSRLNRVGRDYDRVAQSSRRLGQRGAIDFGEIANAATRVARQVREALSVDSLRRFGRELRSLRATDIRVRVGGVPRAIADLVKVRAAAAAAGRDVDINVDVDRRGNFLTRGLARAAAGFVQLASIGVEALGRVGGAVLKLGAGAVDGLGTAFEKVRNTISGTLQSVVALVGEKLGAISKAVGPVGQAIIAAVTAAAAPVAFATLTTTIVGGITALAGPVIAALGGLVGGAIAFLATSALVGLGAAVLPGLAIVLGPAKDQIVAQLQPLKAQLLDAFAPTTDLIVNRIVPAFASVASQILPVVAGVSESFITPIADSLLQLATNPALTEAFTRLAAPIGEGIASIITTFDRIVPIFTEITAAIGPPITAAVNAILEGVALLGFAFRDDIAGAIQVIADLFDRLTPVLGAFGPILEPITRLLAGIIELFANASLQVEAQVGPIGDVLDRLTARLPELQDGFAAAGVLAVKIADGLIAAVPIFNFLLQAATAFAGLLAIVVGGFTLAFSPVIKAVLGFIELVLGAAARLSSGIIAPIADFLGADGVADQLRSGAEAFDQFRTNIEGARQGVDNLGGQLASTGVELLGAAFASDQYSDAANRMADSSEAAAKQQELLTAQMRRGEITVAQWADEVGLGAVPAVQLLGSVVDDLNKRIDEGALSLGNFAKEATRNLPSAADFVEDVEQESGRAAARTQQDLERSQRDQQRRLRDLERQTRRDEQSIQRAAEDYQQAIKDAAELRQEAPEKYTWGAFNFNQVLKKDSDERQRAYEEQIRDAERAIQDRAQALEDAQLQREDNLIALSDAREDIANDIADRALGPDGEAQEEIQRRAFDIRWRISEAYKQIEAEAFKANTLADLRLKGPEFSEFADFLDDLDPEQFRQAVEQFGGAGTAAFEAQAREFSAVAEKNGTIFKTAIAATANALAEEEERLATIRELIESGREALVLQFKDLPADQFNDIIGEIKAQGGAAGLDFANEIAKSFQSRQENVKNEGRELVAKAGEGANEALLALQAEWDKVWGPGGTAEQVGGVVGFAPPPRPGAAPNAATEGATDGEVYAAGVVAGVEGANIGPAVQAQINAAISSVTVDPVAWEQAAAALGQAFNRALGAALSASSAPSGGVAGPTPGGVGVIVGNVAARVGANTAPFATAGSQLGAATVTGVAAGVAASAENAYATVVLLATGIATSVNEAAFETSGEQLGAAVAAGINAGVADNTEAVFDTVKLLAFFLSASANVEAYRESGAKLGAGVVAGVESGVVANAERIYELVRLLGDGIDTSVTVAVFRKAGETLGNAVLQGFSDGINGPGRAFALSALGTLRIAVLLEQESFRGAGVPLGEALGQGLASGLASQTDEIARVAQAIANAITTILRLAFLISSPSRVMADIGADVTRGLAVGIASVDDAERAAAEAASSALDAARAAVLTSTGVEQPFFDAGAALGRAVGDGVRTGLGDGLGVALDSLDNLGGFVTPRPGRPATRDPVARLQQAIAAMQAAIAAGKASGVPQYVPETPEQAKFRADQLLKAFLNGFPALGITPEEVQRPGFFGPGGPNTLITLDRSINNLRRSIEQPTTPIGTGIGAALPARADQLAEQRAVERAAPPTGLPVGGGERVVVEETVINISGVNDSLLAADEIARRVRDRRFLKGRM